MSYMKTDPASIPPSAAAAARRDQIYFREISSPDVRRMYEAIDEVLDPMEYEGSLLFDEYPDTGKLSRLAEQVLRRAKEQTGLPEPDPDTGSRDTGQERDLAKALLCEEMCRRRFRHRMTSGKICY